MPIACSQTVLTGQDGAIYFQPSGTQFCLQDWTDFKAGNVITIPADNDFRVGDPVVFTVEGNATHDTGLTDGDTYYVMSRTNGSITVSSDGTAAGLVTLTGNGGTGTADTAGKENHIKIDYSEFAAVCQVKSFSIDLSREELDTTTLPCGATTTGKYAPFRTMQAGYASGSGSMEVQFTSDQTALANRLLANSMMRNQSGAEVRLFINTVEGAVQGDPDLSKSLYIEAPISIMGFSLSVSPEEVITASLNFNLSGQPTKLLGITV